MFTSDDEHDILMAKAKMLGALNAKILELPEPVRGMLLKTYLSGGATASLMHNEEPKDWDLYFGTMAEMSDFMYVVKEHKNVQELVADINEKYMETLIDGKLVTVNAVTFKNKLQVIIKQTHDMRAHFDFIHCLPYYDIAKDKFYISEQQFNSIKHKKLIVNPNRIEPVSDHRVEKFRQRGWSI